MYRSTDATLPSFSTEKSRPPGELFFDPNLLSTDGTASLSSHEFSKCGKYFAYAISLSGSDNTTIFVRSADSPLVEAHPGMPEGGVGRFDECIRFVKFSSICWTHDSKGFFYQRFPAPDTTPSDTFHTTEDQNAMLFYHRIGTNQSEDILVHKDEKNPQYTFSAQISELDGRYLFLYTSRDTSRKNLLWVTDLEKNEIGQDMKWTKLIDEFEARYVMQDNKGPLLYISTNKDAPHKKIVTVDLSVDPWDFKTFIPEDKTADLYDFVMVKDKFILSYYRNVINEVFVYSEDGKPLKRLAEDFVGTISVYGKPDQDIIFLEMTGFTTPGTIGLYDFAAPTGKEWRIFRQAILENLNPDDFESQQVWFTSKDGTRVPMFVVRHKATPYDGTAGAIQYGYGGFTINITPSFRADILTLCKHYGIIFASVNIRGGGEFGEEWHQAGMRENKPNCFDDFISATKHLVEHKFAAPGKVAINGGSNGGLLVAACVNRAPELFGAAVAEVGVMDYLKFHRFTIGRHWTSDYGNPDDPHDFDFMYPISPVHNVPKNKVLPPYLLLTADHDDRVVPMHSFKLVATLQNTLPSNLHPLLLRVDTRAGHGAGKSTDQRIIERGDKWSFVMHAFGLSWRD